MPEPPAEHATNLRCPRCNYDLYGPVPTWTTSCPTAGTCPECGLTFDWPDIFNRLRDLPPWFFELAEHPTLRLLISTSLRTLFPWRFWRDVRLSFPLRPKRLVTLPIVLCAITYAAGAVMVAAFNSLNRLLEGMSPLQILENLAHPFIVTLYLGWLGDNASRAAFLIWLIPSLITPLCFLLLTDTLTRAKVRPGHLVRAAVYTIVPIPILCFIEHVIRMGAELEILLDPFTWHGRPYMFTNYSPAHTLAGQLIESVAWDNFTWPAFWPAWMLLMWWCVCRSYLRIRHAFATAFLMLAIAFLLVPAAASALDLLMRLAP